MIGLSRVLVSLSSELKRADTCAASERGISTDDVQKKTEEIRNEKCDRPTIGGVSPLFSPLLFFLSLVLFYTCLSRNTRLLVCGAKHEPRHDRTERRATRQLGPAYSTGLDSGKRVLLLLLVGPHHRAILSVRGADWRYYTRRAAAREGKIRCVRRRRLLSREITPLCVRNRVITIFRFYNKKRRVLRRVSNISEYIGDLISALHGKVCI